MEPCAELDGAAILAEDPDPGADAQIAESKRNRRTERDRANLTHTFAALNESNKQQRGDLEAIPERERRADVQERLAPDHVPLSRPFDQGERPHRMIEQNERSRREVPDHGERR